MASSDTDSLSVDDAILDLLWKKEVVDQTEKLALARIASKTQKSLDQVQLSLTSLSSKNLVRRIYFQGKVGFELTPKGKAAMEALAKARADQITKQLQESISQHRKAKLRAGIINKMLSVGDKWQNYPLPDRKVMIELEKEATELLAVTKEVERKQPLCQIYLQSYDEAFLQYKPQIEKLIEQNTSLNKAVNNYAKITACQQLISTDIENVNKTVSKYEPIAEVAIQINQLKATLCNLQAIQTQLEGYDKDQLLRFEEFKSQLADNFRFLEKLKKPTHEFRTIKKETHETPMLYQDPEGPIKNERKTSSYLLEEKCSKCGIKRKATSVTIG